MDTLVLGLLCGILLANELIISKAGVNYKLSDLSKNIHPINNVIKYRLK